jgi:hypothetical protein
MTILAVVGIFLALASSAWAQGRVTLDHPQRFAASVADIGATLTEIQAAVTGQAIYVTDVILQSSTATAGTFALRSGTGTNCATNPIGVMPQPGVATPTLTLGYPGNASAPLQIALSMPFRLPAGTALCIIGTATNLARGQVHGFKSP